MKRKLLKTLLAVIGGLIALVILFFGVLTILEYRPDDVEKLAITGTNDSTIKVGDTIRVASWNIGYGCLGETADFFMDGGTGVKTADEEGTTENVNAAIDWLKAGDYDLIALQETDRDSKRSNHINEYQMVQDSLSEYNSVFASNFKVAYVPYPIPTIGKVDSGLATFSRYEITDAHRNSLPCPFSWPVRTCNLKRCLAITHISVDGSDKEIVFVNLHLEAYDSGEGKKAQTEMLLSLLEEEYANGNYVIATGDFNQVFSDVDTDAYPVLPDKWTPGVIDVSEFGSNWAPVMDSSVPTCRSLDQPYEGADKDNFQYYVIDGAIVSNNINIKEVKTNDLGFKNSDHNPVTLELELTADK